MSTHQPSSGLPAHLAGRVAIMGGSFDPVHVAHEQLARAALAHLPLDAVLWVPAGQPWQKAGARELASVEHRLAMVRLAVAHEPRFVVDDLELRRQGPSYTIDTLVELSQRHPAVTQWFLLIGQDQYARLHTWHRWADILDRVTLAVACRGQAAAATPEPLAMHAHHWVSLPMPPSDVSSTDIRQQLGQGLPATALVPKCLNGAVAGYIEHHQLYAPGSGPAPH